MHALRFAFALELAFFSGVVFFSHRHSLLLLGDEKLATTEQSLASLQSARFFSLDSNSSGSFMFFSQCMLVFLHVECHAGGEGEGC